MNHSIAADGAGAAHLTADGTALEIVGLRLTEAAVITESRRWSTGARGEVVGLEAMGGADLTSFVAQALTIGATAIAAAGAAQDTFELERLVSEVGARAATSSRQAAEETGKAVGEATKLITDASEGARKAITEVESSTRRSFTESVAGAKKDLQAEVQRLFGGEQPELLARLQPMLDSFGASLDAKVGAQTSELLAKAARQFDPSDPTSPMAKHALELAKQQEALTGTLAKNHELLTGKVEALTTAVTVQAAARDAATRTASVTPLKGTTYEDEVHALMQGFAAGLGDDYAETGAIAGRLPRSKKGDAVLAVGDSGTRVVLEMTDSPRLGWGDYLDEAERNRGAHASLGLVRSPTQNAGQSIRVLGSRRMVMAFDPRSDDPALLRTVVLLLRAGAIAAASRSGAEELATAQDKLTEAVGLLDKVDGIQRLAGTIRKNADKVSSECDTFTTAIHRLLSQALDALAGAESDASGEGLTETSGPASSGAA